MTKMIDGMKAYCLLDALTIEREIASENKETFKFRTPNFATLCSRLTELCNLLGRKFCPPGLPSRTKRKAKSQSYQNLREINNRSEDVLCISIWHVRHST